MQSIELKEETLDFRSREAFKTLRTNIDFSGEDVPESVAVCPPDDVLLSDALPDDVPPVDALPDAVADRNTPLLGS